jgi:dihydroorotase
VTVIDPQKRWTVRPDAFASKSRNCPYGGWHLRGRAVVTIVDGRLKYRL